MKCRFADSSPPDRLPVEQVRTQAAVLDDSPLAADLLNALPEGLFLLNPQRQILFANRRGLELAGRHSNSQVTGQRLGEILDCVHAWDSSTGCGAGDSCTQCGWTQGHAVASGGIEDVRECHLTRRLKGLDQCLDLRLRTTPVALGDHACLLLAATDISAEKRRRALERIFFHDAIKLASGAEGILQSLTALAPLELRDYFQLSHEAVRELLDETQAQRDRLAAEQGELELQVRVIDSRELVRHLVEVQGAQLAARGRELRLAPETVEVRFEADRSLVIRVLGTLLKAAGELCPPGKGVTFGCQAEPDGVRFSIQQPGAGAHGEAASGQALALAGLNGCPGKEGTSLDRLVEKHLHGRFGVTTVRGRGTTFWLRLPTAPPREI
jgi:hypothetical protein